MAGGNRPAVRAGIERWQKLADLLQQRRADLGYAARARSRFSRERGINIRRVSDIESLDHPRDNWTIGTLREIARAYEVTYESVTAVLRGEADGLAPALAAPPAPAADGGGWLPSPAGAQQRRWAAAAPYATRILMRLRDLPRPAPGARVFGEGSPDARAWDAFAERGWDEEERAWMIADIQAREAGPAGGREGSAVNGALTVTIR